ncbi:unnamed protein product [Alopecurus aequalis]
MAARNQSSKRRAVDGNTQFPGAADRISRRPEFSMAERRQSRPAVAGNPQSRGGVDRISGLADDMLGQILSFLPAMEAIRSSTLSRRWRRAWTHAPDLKISDELHQDRFLDFAGKVVAQYGTPDIPSLNVAIGCQSNLGTATADWLRRAMARVVGSIRVQVDRYAMDDQLVLPRSLQATAMTLDLSTDFFRKPVLIFPQPAKPGAFNRLSQLSLSNVKIQIHGFGEFLSSTFPELRKLRLNNVHNMTTGDQGLWPLVLHTDMLDELEVCVYQLLLLDVVAAKLRLLTVSHSFESLTSLMTAHTVVTISARRLEAVSWSGRFPKQMTFLTDARSVRRLACLPVYWPSITRIEYSLPDVVQFLETFSAAHQLDVCLDIPETYNPPMLAREDFMGHIPSLPNIRTLSLTIITILRLLRCPLGPSVFSFLRRCPNLTLLHIDLSTLHQFSRLDRHRDHLVFLDDDANNDAAKPNQGREFDPPLRESRSVPARKPPKDQVQLGSLQKIKISGFVGTDPEMELADLLFGAGTIRPALERISISSFAELSGRMDRIALKMKAGFPLAGGRWETSPLKEVTWTKNMD